jgi:hypothetical protein
MNTDRESLGFEFTCVAIVIYLYVKMKHFQITTERFLSSLAKFSYYESIYDIK